MKKIISLFERDYAGDRLVRNQVVSGAEWVLAGEGVATRKYDGTCCLVRDGRFYRRYEIKKGGHAPPNFEPANEVDENTGKQQGWIPVGDGPGDQYHREAWENSNYGAGWPLRDGTYELVGPQIQGNPERFAGHWLLRHGHMHTDDAVKFRDVPRDFEGLKAWLETAGVEGVVWHHPDGRMVKIKRRDFWKVARGTKLAAPEPLTHYGDGTKLPVLHSDQATNHAIYVTELSARLDTMRATAAKLLQDPDQCIFLLPTHKLNLDWALKETDPANLGEKHPNCG